MPDLTETLAERGARYGKFEDHAVIAQGLKDQMWATEGWSRLAPDQRQALEVIQDKVARILNGDPDYTDNWHDIAGYSRLVEDRLNERAAAMAKWDEPGRIAAGASVSAHRRDRVAVDERTWIEWTGGDCPVARGTFVDVKHRDGRIYFGVKARTSFAHTWDADVGDGTIIAYRLSTKQD